MTADEGRAAARRAEIAERLESFRRDPEQWSTDELIRVLDEDGHCHTDREFLGHAPADIEWLLAECDRRSRAVEALKPYVLHRATCEIVTEPHPRVNFCTCGLDEALASRAPAADKEPS
jgi:hypothetical protein